MWKLPHCEMFRWLSVGRTSRGMSPRGRARRSSAPRLPGDVISAGDTRSLTLPRRQAGCSRVADLQLTQVTQASSVPLLAWAPTGGTPVASSKPAGTAQPPSQAGTQPGRAIVFMEPGKVTPGEASPAPKATENILLYVSVVVPVALWSSCSLRKSY